MSPTACVILALGALGHIVLWVALVNRTHALGIKRLWVDLITLVCGIMLAALPLLVAAILAGLIPAHAIAPDWIASRFVWTYLTLCAAVFIVALLQRLKWLRNPERQGSLLSHQTSFVCHTASQEPLLAPGIPSWLGLLPGN